MSPRITITQYDPEINSPLWDTMSQANAKPWKSVWLIHGEILNATFSDFILYSHHWTVSSFHKKDFETDQALNIPFTLKQVSERDK